MSEARQENYYSGKETWEGNREVDMRDLRALEGDEGRRSDGDLQPDIEGAFAPAPKQSGSSQVGTVGTRVFPTFAQEEVISSAAAR
jgi:hypothetical protein